MSRARSSVLWLALWGALSLSFGCAKRLPDALRPELDKTPKGQLLIVEFMDFECPYCRQNHMALRHALEPYAGRVRLVRKQVPLEKHPMARPAARAAVCAEKLGKGDAMADALAQAPLEDIGQQGILKLGVEVGLDKDMLASCVNNPATEARLAEDEKLFLEVGATGVPRMWIGATELRGVQEEETFAQALAAVLK